MLLKRFASVLNVLRNKYISSIIVFIVWISFFDRNDLWTQLDRKHELQKLETSKTFYEQEIATTRKDLMDLNNNPAVLEKFAREKFYLKKANEEIFIIDDSTQEKK
ncbi:MAG: cell division protein DivIC (FtsB), stabilizes FtsL against RasP cleavage [Segetibacter sp.]|jgi:cell division protein FtsB|nr:cell division protein DivIC (FtsB), stabilizes FtsL against RasP cleavage [Segetibacter sp.]